MLDGYKGYLGAGGLIAYGILYQYLYMGDLGAAVTSILGGLALLGIRDKQERIAKGA